MSLRDDTWDPQQGGNAPFDSVPALMAASAFPPFQRPSLSIKQLSQAQASVVAQCKRAHAAERLQQQASPLVTPSMEPSRSCSAFPSIDSGTASISSMVPESPSLIDGEGREVVLFPYLPTEEVSQRMHFVTDLAARMQERAHQRGRRGSTTTFRTPDTGSRSSGAAPMSTKHRHHHRPLPSSALGLPYGTC